MGEHAVGERSTTRKRPGPVRRFFAARPKLVILLIAGIALGGIVGMCAIVALLILLGS